MRETRDDSDGADDATVASCNTQRDDLGDAFIHTIYPSFLPRAITQRIDDTMQ